MVEFELDKKSPVPFYRQIVDLVLAGISRGSILPGDKLPTIRDLAVRLEVNPNTVVKAYSQLESLGALDTQQGSGVFVRAAPAIALSPEDRRRAVETICLEFVRRAQLLDIHLPELVEHLRKMMSPSENR
jgi:GntR family transcriptional regulator